MKKFLIIAAITIALTGCDDKIEKPGQITLTTTATGEYKLYITGTGSAIIDWGDSNRDIVTLSLPTDPNFFGDNYFTHNYASANAKTIKVIGNILSLSTGCTGEVTALDVSKMPALEVLMCLCEKLTSLDVGKNTALTYLSCLNNNLDSLDVSKNTALTILWCGGNNLTKLDVSKNTALIWLICSKNNLTTLTLGTHNALELLDCNNNNLSKQSLVDIFKKLPMRIPTDNARIHCGGCDNPNPGFWQLTDYDIKIAEDKKWKVESCNAD